MHSYLSTSLIALTVGILPFSASASDLNGRTSDPTSAEYVAHRPAFQGIGVGVHMGGQFTNVEISHKDSSFDGIGADGLVGGVHGEYLFGVAGNFRVGPYVEGGFSNVNTNIELGGGDIDLLEQKHYYGGGVKAGMVFFNSALLYVRAGIERAKWEFAEEIDVDVDSWVLGGGAEAMIADNVSLGLGLDYVTPFNIEAEGHDITDFFDETESFRGVVRLTYRR